MKQNLHAVNALKTCDLYVKHNMLLLHQKHRMQVQYTYKNHMTDTVMSLKERKKKDKRKRKRKTTYIMKSI